MHLHHNSRPWWTMRMHDRTSCISAHASGYLWSVLTHVPRIGGMNEDESHHIDGDDREKTNQFLTFTNQTLTKAWAKLSHHHHHHLLPLREAKTILFLRGGKTWPSWFRTIKADRSTENEKGPDGLGLSKTYDKPRQELERSPLRLPAKSPKSPERREEARSKLHFWLCV